MVCPHCATQAVVTNSANIVGSYFGYKLAPQHELAIKVAVPVLTAAYLFSIGKYTTAQYSILISAGLGAVDYLAPVATPYVAAGLLVGTAAYKVSEAYESLGDSLNNLMGEILIMSNELMPSE
jgi:hypothetical protein